MPKKGSKAAKGKGKVTVIKVKVCTSSTVRCNKEACMICFPKTFASHPRVAFWDYVKNGAVKPWTIALNHTKKCWFICESVACGHSFDACPNSIVSQNTWCRFCAGAICGDIMCMICKPKSFASHPKSEFWDFMKNKLAPWQVTNGVLNFLYKD